MTSLCSRCGRAMGSIDPYQPLSGSILCSKCKQDLKAHDREMWIAIIALFILCLLAYIIGRWI